jgi:hypothetical protein
MMQLYVPSRYVLRVQVFVQTSCSILLKSCRLNPQFCCSDNSAVLAVSMSQVGLLNGADAAALRLSVNKACRQLGSGDLAAPALKLCTRNTLTMCCMCLLWVCRRCLLVEQA